MKRTTTLLLIAAVTLTTTLLRAEEKTPKKDKEGFVSIFDGKTFNGWKKAKENPDSWKIKDGAFVCDGPRCHLFYVGDDKPFKNFEFKADVMTQPGSNGGIYFHTKYQETGWPKAGFETQVNITHGDTIKTGSLYGVVKVTDPPAKDKEWWSHHIIVKDKRVIVKINGKTVVDYTEPEGQKPASRDFARLLGEGTFALQAHDPKSVVAVKNIRVKRLP